MVDVTDDCSVLFGIKDKVDNSHNRTSDDFGDGSTLVHNGVLGYRLRVSSRRAQIYIEGLYINISRPKEEPSWVEIDY